MASKSDLAKAVAQAEGISIKNATSIIDTTLKTLAELTKTEKVTLIGFGSFQAKTSKERPGRNPRTGEAITIPARTSVHFKSSSKLVTKQPVTTRQAKQTTKNSKNKSRKTK